MAATFFRRREVVGAAFSFSGSLRLALSPDTVRPSSEQYWCSLPERNPRTLEAEGTAGAEQRGQMGSGRGDRSGRAEGTDETGQRGQIRPDRGDRWDRAEGTDEAGQRGQM